MSETIRVQLDIPEEKMTRIRELMGQTGVATQKEYFSNALSLLDWAIQQKSKGHLVGALAEEDNRFKEVVMPTLHTAPQVSSSAK